jgi:hypothetical protein
MRLKDFLNINPSTMRFNARTEESSTEERLASINSIVRTLGYAVSLLLLIAGLAMAGDYESKGMTIPLIIASAVNVVLVIFTYRLVNVLIAISENLKQINRKMKVENK